jgi:hypothetical protein
METTKEILAILGKPVSDTLPREQNPTSIASSHRDWTLPSAFLRRFHFEGRNLSPDPGAAAFWALNFFSLPLVFRDRIGELESFSAFLALKFVSGHSLLPLVKNAEDMPFKKMV